MREALPEYRNPGAPLVPLFVYGTLRPGGALAYMLKGVTAGVIYDVQVPGLALYDVQDSPKPIYPVAVQKTGAVAMGDLLFCAPGRALQRVFQMELGSGYMAVRFQVGGLREDDARMFRSCGMSEGTQAWAFVYPARSRHGSRIEGDDWANRDWFLKIARGRH